MNISSLIYDSWKRDCQLAKYRGMLPMLGGIGGKVLDVGIGTALFEEFLAQNGVKIDVVGIDPDPKMLEKAMARGYTAVQGIAECLPFENESFDWAICIDTLHNADGAKALAEMRRVLKPGGHILISLFCNTFNSGKAMAELEALVSGLALLDKRVVGNANDELSAAALCRK